MSRIEERCVIPFATPPTRCYKLRNGDGIPSPFLIENRSSGKECEMIDLLKKGFWMGLGAAVIAKETVGSVTGSLVRKDKLTANEAEDMSKELLDEAKKDIESIQSKGRKEIEKILSEFQWVSREEFEALKGRVDDLESRLS